MQSLLPTTTTTAPNKDPITCHVLDTSTGLPARNLHVSLTLLKPLGPSTPFTALTDADGRITSWGAQAGPALSDIFENASEHEASEAEMVWSLRFDTGAYFGPGRTFWPEVDVRFFVRRGRAERYHVPVLLGPWSYTTYRGS